MNVVDRNPALAAMNDSVRHGGRQAMFGFLHLALITPSIYLVLGLPLVLRQHGWSGTEIGLFQLAGLSAVFKFALAVPVERMRWAAGHYKIWVIGVCVAYATLLLAIGQQDLTAGDGRLFLMALGAGLMATWADIPVNALAIKTLPLSEQMRAGGFRSAAIFLGAIIGGGFQVWHRYFTPRDVVDYWLPDAFDQPVKIGEVSITPGDYLFGDLDGLICIPKEAIESALGLAEAAMAQENLVRTAILEGVDPQEADLKYGKF